MRSRSQDWLRTVLEADGLSDYRETAHHHHRVDWVGRSVSALSMAAVGFVVVAAGIGMARARPAVTAEVEQLRIRVEAEQLLTGAAETEYLAARAALRQTQDAVRPDLDGALAAALDTQGLAAGFVALAGPGVVLTLDNAKQPSFEGTVDLGRLIDRDVQHAVNGLWEAGAEAIAVDGIRLTNRTAIRNAGNTILVDYKPVSTPIRITALGDAKRMTAAFRATTEWDELTALHDQYGVRWSFSPHTRLAVPAGASMLPTIAQTEGAA